MFLCFFFLSFWLAIVLFLAAARLQALSLMSVLYLGVWVGGGAGSWQLIATAAQPAVEACGGPLLCMGSGTVTADEQLPLGPKGYGEAQRWPHWLDRLLRTSQRRQGASLPPWQRGRLSATPSFCLLAP